LRKSLKLSTLSLVAIGLIGCLPFDLGGVSVGQTVTYSEGAYICTPDDAAHIMIPPGALTSDTTITISRLGEYTEREDRQIVGAAWDFGPNGTRFAQPVWIQLHPSPLPEGVRVSDLSLFHESGGIVEELDDVQVDELNGTISGYANHFSVFYAAYTGTIGGRAIHVGGANLTPYFGSSSSSDNPTEIPIWVAPGGLVSTNPYSGEESDLLVIQVNTDPPMPNTPLYIEGWTISPVDPGVVVGPTGDRISTYGFWHDFFGREIVNPMRNLRTDADGHLTLVIRGDRLYSQMSSAPPGYGEGRLRLRVAAVDGPEAMDVNLAFSRLR